ncbi:hypothetical protein [Ureibacillus chungkukjangi]|nr:hypothetical protein [Ureibacillus chungkukjangi]
MECGVHEGDERQKYLVDLKSGIHEGDERQKYLAGFGMWRS